jgi:transcriptional regulator with XRE-family HTH domain
MTSVVLAYRVKLLRKSNNYTQVQLAKKVGVSQGCISLIECKGLVPSYPVLYVLADVLHTTTDYLLPEGPEDPKSLEIAILKEKIKGKYREIEQLKERITDLESSKEE